MKYILIFFSILSVSFFGQTSFTNIPATFGTTGFIETGSDVYAQNPYIFNYELNFESRRPSDAIYKFGNKDTSAGATSNIFLGDMWRARYLALEVIPDFTPIGGMLSSQAFIASGSGMTNGMTVYADNGVLAMGTVPNAQGVNNLVVGPTPDGFVGIGTRSPQYDLDILKSKNSGIVSRIKNNSSGSSALSSIRVQANGTSSTNIYHTSTGFTPQGTHFGADMTVFHSTSTVQTSYISNSPHVFCVNGYGTNNEVFRIASNGVFYRRSSALEPLISVESVANISLTNLALYDRKITVWINGVKYYLFARLATN